MQPEPRHPLTISDLAGRTGVPAATLRSWEARYGFPTPARMAGGHRRYAEPDVAAVLEVLRHRDAGLALESAVRRVTAESVQPRSFYAELRRAHPTLPTQVLSKPSLIALSRAIEDECCARAQEPLLFGCFQRDSFLRASRARWVELARSHDPEQGQALARLAAALFAEPNPTVIKAVLHVQGRIPSPDVRLPLLPAGRPSLGAALRALAASGDTRDRTYALIGETG